MRNGRRKDYSMPFKLSVVREIETTSISPKCGSKKYGYKVRPQ